MIPTYGGILSAIEKALQELVEEYQGKEYAPIRENWGRNGVEIGLKRREWEWR